MATTTATATATTTTTTTTTTTELTIIKEKITLATKKSFFEKMKGEFGKGNFVRIANKLSHSCPMKGMRQLAQFLLGKNRIYAMPVGVALDILERLPKKEGGEFSRGLINRLDKAYDVLGASSPFAAAFQYYGTEEAKGIIELLSENRGMEEAEFAAALEEAAGGKKATRAKAALLDFQMGEWDPKF